MTAEELAQELDLHIDVVRAALASLIEKGLVRERGGPAPDGAS